MINIKTKSFEYRISKIVIKDDGKSDCFAQRLKEDNTWGKVENVRLRRLLAELGLKQTRGVRNLAKKAS